MTRLTILRAPALAALVALAPLAAPTPSAAQSGTPGGMEMSAEDRAAFRAEVRAYLLDNPEVIMEAIEILEQKRSEATRQSDGDLVASHSEALLNDGFSWVGGDPDGALTLVEFSDYRCGYCKRAHPIVAELMERMPNLRVVLKEFPILGPDSLTAGRMAVAALDIDPDRYKALHDALMEHQGTLTEAAAYRVAAEVGYDIAALKSRAGQPEIEERLRATYDLANSLGLQGTPSFVIGNRILRGFLPLEDMLAVVEEEQARLAN